MSTPKPAADVQRLSVNINDESARILAEVMADRGINATEAIRRAVAYLGLVEDVRSRGARIVLGGAS
jgi:hypothetical protein